MASSTRIGGIHVDMGLSTAKFEQGVRKTKREAAGLGASLKSSLGNVGRTAFSGLTVGITAALAPMALFRTTLVKIREAADLAGVSKKIGIGVEALQRLRYGFEQNGVAANVTDMALQRFGRRVADAANGSGELYKLFKANGVQLRDNEGKLRSQVDILRDYANLIKNAGSAQEQLSLAFKGFDSEGAALVTALRDGADGVDKLMRAADDAGGVIDRELVDKAAELDDAFVALWHNFDVNSSNAFLTAASAIDELIKSANDFGNTSFFKWLSGKLGSSGAVFVPGEGVFNEGDKNTPSSRVARAFLGDQQTNPALEKALLARYGDQGEKPKATIIPGSGGGGGGSSRNAALAAANRQAEAVLHVIERLEQERALIGATDVERRKANALRLAGAAATDEQKAKIGQLVEAIYREAEAHEKAADAMREINDVGRETLGGLISDLVHGKDAAEAFADALSNIGDRLINSGLDALFSTGGGGGGGLLGGLGKALGFRASGGPVTAGMPYIVGEKRPELFVPRQSGMVIPQVPTMPAIASMRGGDSTPVNVNIQIDAKGADREGLLRVEQQVAKLKSELPAHIVQGVRKAQKSNVKF